VTIEVPTALLHVMRTMVKEEGLYNSITDVILETLRNEFVSKQYLEDAKKRALEVRHDAVQIL
jgi:Arc/MetJ-type ribon-helix-helix transcriptional regulator